VHSIIWGSDPFVVRHDRPFQGLSVTNCTVNHHGLRARGNATSFEDALKVCRLATGVHAPELDKLLRK
jgi:hypothetical protein